MARLPKKERRAERKAKTAPLQTELRNCGMPVLYRTENAFVNPRSTKKKSDAVKRRKTASLCRTPRPRPYYTITGTHLSTPTNSLFPSPLGLHLVGEKRFGNIQANAHATSDLGERRRAPSERESECPENKREPAEPHDGDKRQSHQKVSHLL